MKRHLNSVQPAAATFLIALLFLCAAPVMAQTCSQCQNTAAAAPPQAQRAARRAIITLLVPALGITGIIAGATYRQRNSFAANALPTPRPAAEVAPEKPL